MKSCYSVETNSNMSSELCNIYDVMARKKLRKPDAYYNYERLAIRLA